MADGEDVLRLNLDGSLWQEESGDKQPTIINLNGGMWHRQAKEDHPFDQLCDTTLRESIDKLSPDKRSKTLQELSKIRNCEEVQVSEDKQWIIIKSSSGVVGYSLDGCIKCEYTPDGEFIKSETEYDSTTGKVKKEKKYTADRNLESETEYDVNTGNKKKKTEYKQTSFGRKPGVETEFYENGKVKQTTRYLYIQNGADNFVKQEITTYSSDGKFFSSCIKIYKNGTLNSTEDTTEQYKREQKESKKHEDDVPVRSGHSVVLNPITRKKRRDIHCGQKTTTTRYYAEDGETLLRSEVISVDQPEEKRVTTYNPDKTRKTDEIYEFREGKWVKMRDVHMKKVRAPIKESREAEEKAPKEKATGKKAAPKKTVQKEKTEHKKSEKGNARSVSKKTPENSEEKAVYLPIKDMKTGEIKFIKTTPSEIEQKASGTGVASLSDAERNDPDNTVLIEVNGKQYVMTQTQFKQMVEEKKDALMTAAQVKAEDKTPNIATQTQQSNVWVPVCGPWGRCRGYCQRSGSQTIGGPLTEILQTQSVPVYGPCKKLVWGYRTQVVRKEGVKSNASTETMAAKMRRMQQNSGK